MQTSNHNKEIEELFNEHFNHLVMYINRYVSSISVSKDLAQDIFVKTIERRDKITNMRYYIFTCGRNAAIDYLKANTKNRKISIEEIENKFEESSYEDTLDYYKRVDTVTDLIDHLPKQCREVLMKIYFDKKKFSEVADEMNLSINTIKSHVYLGKKALKDLFSIFINTFFV